MSQSHRTTAGLLKPFHLHGSVSYGTFDPAVLLPAFEGLLRSAVASRKAWRRPGLAPLLADTEALLDTEDFDGEAAVEVLADLAAMLNELAPKGYYFGSLSPGDSDFGYWLDGA